MPPEVLGGSLESIGKVGEGIEVGAVGAVGEGIESGDVVTPNVHAIRPDRVSCGLAAFREIWVMSNLN